MNLRCFLTVPVLLATGCAVSSLEPIYTPHDVVFRHELIGTWHDPQSTDDTIEISREREDGDAYLIVYRGSDAQETLHLRARLCTIGKRMYMDIDPAIDDAVLQQFPPEAALMRPIHLFYMVE